MVLEFFRRGGESGLDSIENRIISMLGDARHSFDMATTAVLSGGDPELVSADILDTDSRINEAEQELRSELVVHVSVQGTSDIGTVLSYTLLIKKIERIGDQAKNILDLAFEGVSFADAPDAAELSEHRQAISELFGRVSDAMSEPDEGAVEALLERATELR
ncbi:MAG: PhoU domain-containing protein, partial [Acidimicrobiia bacterium]|nr:PhoU domain-containing protein [Acidimicrobiia bacterium]